MIPIEKRVTQTITYGQSFFEPLHKFKYSLPTTETRQVPLRTSTANLVPIKYWLPYFFLPTAKRDELENFVNQQASNQAETAAALAGVLDSVDSDPKEMNLADGLPYPYFPDHILRSEEDVARASEFQLLDPVCRALSRLIDVNKLPIKIDATAQQVEDKSRADITFVYTKKNHLREIKFAILEYKNTFSISEADFEDAKLEEDTVENHVLMMDRVADSHNDTLLIRNAIPLAQQAGKYSRLCKCRYVAIFDYRRFIGFRFGAAPLGEEADYAELDIFNPDSNPDRRHTHRMWLLSFLWEALLNSYNGQSTRSDREKDKATPGSSKRGSPSASGSKPPNSASKRYPTRSSELALPGRHGALP